MKGIRSKSRLNRDMCGYSRKIYKYFNGDLNAAFIVEHFYYHFIQMSDPDSLSISFQGDFPLIFISTRAIEIKFPHLKRTAASDAVRRLVDLRMLREFGTTVVPGRSGRVKNYIFNHKRYEDIILGQPQDYYEGFDDLHEVRDDVDGGHIIEPSPNSGGEVAESFPIMGKTEGLIDFNCVSQNESHILSNALDLMSSGKMRKVLNEGIANADVNREYFIKTYFQYYRDKIGESPSERFLKSSIAAHSKNCKAEGETRSGKIRQSRPSDVDYTSQVQFVLKIAKANRLQGFNETSYQNKVFIDRESKGIEMIIRRYGFTMADFRLFVYIQKYRPPQSSHYGGFKFRYFVGESDEFLKDDFEKHLSKLANGFLTMIENWKINKVVGENGKEAMDAATELGKHVSSEWLTETLNKWKKL